MARERSDTILGGRISLTVDGEVMQCVGDATLNYGYDKNEPLVGQDGFHGLKVMPQAATIKIKVRDRGSLDLAKVANARDATVAVEKPNGKTAVMRHAAFTGSGDLSTEEGEFDSEWAGPSMEDV